MLKGFEDLTPHLSDSDEVLAAEIARGLAKRIGKVNAISNRNIRKLYEDKKKIRIGDIRFRKMIQFIRVNNLVPCLCSNSNGYFVAASEEDWTEWKTSMEQRIRQMTFTLETAKLFNDGEEKL